MPLLNAHYCDTLSFISVEIIDFNGDLSPLSFTGARLAGPLHMYRGQLTRGIRPEHSASSERHV